MRFLNALEAQVPAGKAPWLVNRGLPAHQPDHNM